MFVRVQGPGCRIQGWEHACEVAQAPLAPELKILGDDTEVFDNGPRPRVEVQCSPFEYIPGKSSMGKVELEYRITLRGSLYAWHPIEDGLPGSALG